MRIIYKNPDDSVVVLIPAPEFLDAEGIEAIAAKDVPEGRPFIIVKASDVPSDRTFRDAWVIENKAVVVNLAKAKAVGHDIRRAKRAEEFAPHDEVIAKQIPGADFAKAEEARAAIRQKYEGIQAAIDAATDPAQIKAALGI